MARIKAIHFFNAGRAEGCTCDRCGQYIQNVWTVEYAEGTKINYGVDCWQKVKRQGLDDYNRRKLAKIEKSIKAYEEQLAKYVNGEYTADNCEGYKNAQADWNTNNAFHGESFESWKSWHVNEFFPYRIAEAQKELAKIAKINI